MADQAKTTGQDDDVIFEERLWPATWIWAFLLGVSMVWILILAPISLIAGYITAAALTIILTILLVRSTPKIVITGRTLQVGRATVERRFVGAAEGFQGEAATEQRGPRLDGRAYLCIRGWISPVVRMQIVDEADPTPYWLASTRRPKQLTAALATVSTA